MRELKERNREGLPQKRGEKRGKTETKRKGKAPIFFYLVPLSMFILIGHDCALKSSSLLNLKNLF